MGGVSARVSRRGRRACGSHRARVAAKTGEKTLGGSFAHPTPGNRRRDARDVLGGRARGGIRDAHLHGCTSEPLARRLSVSCVRKRASTTRDVGFSSARRETFRGCERSSRTYTLTNYS
eukprot:31376-Pelagococcus_subviridis.AAC.17